MVRENAAAKDDTLTIGTDLVVLDTTRRKSVTPLRQIIDKANEGKGKKPYYQALVLQYLGNKKWRLGAVPVDGGKAEWSEGLPFDTALVQIAQLEGNIKRIDHTSPQYRDYT